MRSCSYNIYKLNKKLTTLSRCIRKVRPQGKSLSPKLERQPGGYREPQLTGARTRSRHLGKPGGWETWTRTEEPLQGPCGWVWEVKPPGRPTHRGTHNIVSSTSSNPTKSSEQWSEKHPFGLPAREGKGNTLGQKRALGPLTRPVSGETVSLNLTCWGFIRA